MAIAKKPASKEATVTIPELKQAEVRLRLIGTTPLYQNRMAAKAKHTLLVGGAKKTAADRVHIKHQPLEEFRDAAERLPWGPTALGLKVTAFKRAMATAALETPGAKKTSVQRLLFMPGEHFSLYGTPQLRMDIVRSADMKRTPDVRSRPYLPKWGAEITVRFPTPQLSLQTVATLLSYAGVLVGVGDNRQEKGSGNYGLFRVLGAGDTDDEWDELVAEHAREAQEAALADPEYANAETAELMEFFHGEVNRRKAA